MFEKINYPEDLNQAYEMLMLQLNSLCDENFDPISNLANASALLNYFLKDINWVGFYIYKNNELILGPFQGLPACIKIPLNRGVCGQAASKQKTIVVSDVLNYFDHIACDANSKSEIVIPIIIDNKLFGVLDIDSPIYDRFSKIDQIYLERFVEILKNKLR